ncbi:TMEM43 family protein [Brevundimonas sp. FT23028]|uniref:TMEM43 family protein n=1 Tax=Brevundimonas sp. FT23028 TaxID=3393748 RepID=UPI003B58A6CB
MAPDQITETTHRSWFQRLGAAVTGVLAGFVIVVLAIGLLAWNEGNAIARMRGLGEGARNVVEAPLARIDPANEGRLVHLSGPLTVDGAREDPLSGVAAPGVSLRRTVEVYQWVETRRSETRTKLGGGEETVTTYDYQRGWSDSPVASSEFHAPAGHENPAPPVDATTISAAEGRLGAYRVDRRLLDAVPATSPVVVTDEHAQRLAAALSRPVKVENDALYVGADPANPVVGDLRVRYLSAPLADVSVAAAQSTGALAPYVARNGSEIYLTSMGSVTAVEMFRQAKDGARMLSWILRAVGVAGLMFGLGLILGPISTLADVLPPLGAVVRFGAGALAAVGGLAIGAVVIAVSWFAVRPVFAGVCLAVAGLAVAALFWWRGRRRAA